MFKENFIMSWENIINNKMRSFLTALGIVIGVASVIALITIVNGVTGAVMDEFSSLGTGKLSVMAGGTVLKQGLTTEEMQTIEETDNVAAVSPSVTLTGTAGMEGTVVEDISIQGKTELYFAEQEDLMLKGRGLTSDDVEQESYVCVIDDVLADKFFYGASPLGQNIQLNGQTYTVVGISDSDSSDLMAAMSGGGASEEGSAIITYKNALALAGTANVTNLDVYLVDSNLAEQTTTDIEAVLDEAFNYKDDSYSVTNLDSIVEMMDSMQSMLTALLAGIASISLVVGGIGIMNMMLVSVTERTKEIGLRKALGAEPVQIQIQFIIEAITLSVIGGGIGIIIGLALSYVASLVIGTTFAISWGAIALGAGFSLAVGVFFGWSPAKKASELRPIDALRSE